MFSWAEQIFQDHLMISCDYDTRDDTGKESQLKVGVRMGTTRKFFKARQSRAYWRTFDASTRLLASHDRRTTQGVEQVAIHFCFQDGLSGSRFTISKPYRDCFVRFEATLGTYEYVIYVMFRAEQIATPWVWPSCRQVKQNHLWKGFSSGGSWFPLALKKSWFLVTLRY